MLTSDNIKVRKGMDLVDDMEIEELNQLVDYIRYVYKAKRQQDSARVAATLAIGDRVRLCKIKPLYLQGQTGEIVEKKQTKFVVRLDNGPTGKFRDGRVICAPLTMEKI